MGDTKDYNEYVGCKAHFRLKNEQCTFSGDIQNVDVRNSIITFHKVAVEESGKSTLVFGNLQYYHINEIEDITVKTDEVNEGLKKVSLKKVFERHTEPSKRKSIHHSKDTPKHLNQLTTYDATKLYMMAIVEEEIEKTKDQNGQYESVLPPECQVVNDCKSKLFREAVDYLKGFAVLGVSFEGISLGRSGQLCWILMSSPGCTIFFDIKAMGKDCFEAGLKEILEESDIMKIIHDCRRPSDILHHQFNVNLVNIFDTQVAAVFITKLQKKEFPRYVTNLPDCLRDELNIDHSRLHFPLLRECNPEKDEEVWNLRPSPTIVLSWMHKHCCYLLDLQKRQMEQMMMEFTMGVDIFLENLRDANRSDANMRMENPHLVPTEFRGLQMLVDIKFRDAAHRKKRLSHKYTDSAQTDEYGWIENCAGISHPEIIACHDTIWHTPTNGNLWKSENRNDFGADKKSPEKVQTKVIHENGTTNAANQIEPTSSKCVSNGQVDKQQLSNFDQNRWQASVKKETLIDLATSGSSENNSTPSSPPSVCAQQDKLSVSGRSEEVDTQVTTEKALTMLRKTKKELQEKLNNGFSNAPSGDYLIRPAGETKNNISKKTQRELQKQRDLHAKDLAGRTGQPCVKPGEVDENEFDAIPSQKVLQGKQQPVQMCTLVSDSLVPASAQGLPAPEDAGFKIASFSDAVHPPPFCASSEENTSMSVSEALAAILPRVEDCEQLLTGSRTSTSRSPADSDTGPSNHSSPHTNPSSRRALRSNKHRDASLNDASSRILQSTDPRNGRSSASVSGDSDEHEHRSKSWSRSDKLKKGRNLKTTPNKPQTSGNLTEQVSAPIESVCKGSHPTVSSSPSYQPREKRQTVQTSNGLISNGPSFSPSLGDSVQTSATKRVDHTKTASHEPVQGGIGLLAFYKQYMCKGETVNRES